MDLHPRITRTGFVFACVALLLGGAAAPLSPAAATTQTFEFTGAAEDFVVPARVRSIDVEACAGSGGTGNLGAAAGLGAHVEARISVTPGETLTIRVGGDGGSRGPTDIGAGGAGGFNGGGEGGSSANRPGGGGGGASDVSRGSTALVIAAGGGGSGGFHSPGMFGGGGDGGASGEDGANGEAAQGGKSGGNGGAGGAGAGTGGVGGGGGGALQGGDGGDNDASGAGAGGGGGAGTTGGGGGGSSGTGVAAGGGGGGGGSSLTPLGSVTGTCDTAFVTLTYQAGPAPAGPVEAEVEFTG